MSNDYRPPAFRLTPEERKALLARADEARSNSRVAAARCALLLAAAEVRVRETEATIEEAREIMNELEKNVRSYARVLRQSDTPPDQALLLVKEAIAFEIPARNLATRRLLDDVAVWCIDAYYAA
jgi:hypothetical protein